ncbi:MCM DNA helicase complex subunit [Brettanomyces nanus]|uniref:DNA replication licensing factor MCM2 n=1 Tax=Eeniella nana TaxID=13502 RepID=A0A875RZG7_EENNA|nr:MCM DNA helicase complex subunit [Brettanomyces nanus]QPG73425.1 MCM DNA helicase complex subunit [Brettanomyces nanus]
MSDNPSPRKRTLQSDDEGSSDEEVFATSSSQPQSSPAPPSSLPSSPRPEELPSSPAVPFDEDAEENEERKYFNDIDDLEERLEEQTGVDLIGDDMTKDYKSKPIQDRYDIDDIDDNKYAALPESERRRVDEMLTARDKLRKKRAGGEGDLDLDEGEGADDGPRDEYGLPIQRRRRRHRYDEDPESYFDDVDPLTEELSLDALSEVKASSILEWITMPNVTRSIARELKSFLLEYTDEYGRSVYGSRIKTLGEMNSESLEVSYMHILQSKAVLALFLTSCPEEMLKIFDVVAMEATALHYPDYGQIHSEIHVRIADFPSINQLRELRESHLNSLVRITGVVTRRTGVFPQLKYVKFDCLKCGAVLGPYFQDSNQEVRVSYCTNCQSRGPFRLNSEKTVYRNYQRITLQESPSSVPPGRIPRHKEAILLWDLVDSAKPGEEIEVTGIYKNSYDGTLNAKNGFPVFATVIEANSVKKREGAAKGATDAASALGSSSLSPFQWTEDEEKQIIKLSKERGIVDKIISSMAPSIYGHKDIKTAVACALFGGVPKDVNGKHSIRGDINVLLLGDPGTAKSQILKYVEKTAHRAVFATGQGASAVGLTASVRRDPVTQEWTLEGGALVLADKGVCLIDEFDKMNDQDRTSIHEAMEQQTISISKAGIVTTLQARCSIIAAANPIGGRYNSTLDLQRNVNLTEPILSRFDIVCVVRDLVNPEADERLASFVIDSHIRSHPLNDDGHDGDEEMDIAEEGETENLGEKNEEDLISARRRKEERIKKQKESEISPIPQELLIKYIHYARSRVHPKLNQMDMDKVSRVYVDLRKESNTTGSFPITVRHLESILRMAEAFAKMRLNEYVSSTDLDRAIKVVIDSFVGTQKVSIRKQLQRSFMKYTLPLRGHGQQISVH